MTNQFETLKNGKNAIAVWANTVTKEITVANRNSFGYNVHKGLDQEFSKKYGCNLKYTQGKGSNYRNFYHSANSMNEIGFKLVLRGEQPLW
jgi:ABC-type thiamine transport system substrate-binding protein